MLPRTRCLGVILFGLGMMALGMPSAARAQVVGGKSYALIGIMNSSGQTVTYHYRWGSGEWKEKTLASGSSWRHWWENYSKSPAFHIAFKDGAGNWVRRQLQANNAAFTEYELARKYRFLKVIGATGGINLESYDKD